LFQFVAYAQFELGVEWLESLDLDCGSGRPDLAEEKAKHLFRWK
jgi:hypothetical protein